MRRVLGCVLMILAVGGAAAPSAAGQSQAINGTIEAVARDASGAVLPGVTITVTRPETGLQRMAVTNADGRYVVPLLPVGTYRVRAELSGFKTVERRGIALSAGRTATIDLVLEVGAVEELVEVTTEAPIAEPARIDLGRTIGQEEIANLPNVSRNTYNFALLQPNVTGYETRSSAPRASTPTARRCASSTRSTARTPRRRTARDCGCSSPPTS